MPRAFVRTIPCVVIEKEKTKMNRVIEYLIEQKIAMTDFSLDLQGSDRKILQLACKDFANYMKFNNKSKSHMKPQQWQRISDEDLAEFESFLTIWVSKWMNKWQERVKLLIGKQNKRRFCQELKNLEKVETLWEKLECKKELIEAAQSTLINNGESCGSELLAEHAVKLELACNTDVDFADKKRALTFLCSIMHRAQEIAKNRGPLLFVEVNKSYYS
jgi:hypothetical protein